MSRLRKPFEKGFFNPWFPIVTDRDGGPDFKDCKPFDPTKQHEESVQ